MPRILVHGLLVVLAAIAAAHAYELLVPSASRAARPHHSAHVEHTGPRPAIANLNPDLLGALRQAEGDAAKEGVDLAVNSGWRSRNRQQRLLDQAVVKYGSLAAAARWVATPETSPHVSGDAIDVGPSDAAAWLSEHGAAYGLCRIYANEPWHFELRPEAVNEGCPPMYADPTHDPRMQQ